MITFSVITHSIDHSISKIKTKNKVFQIVSYKMTT